MTSAPSTLFSGGRLLDPRRTELLDSVDVLVENGLIKEVSDRPISASGANRLELKGRTIMPGLIDAHVRMYYNEDTIGQLQFVPTTYAAVKAAFVLKGMLMRGFTTVRDMAGGDFGMRAASEAKYVDVPRLFISGRAITQTGGHGDFRDRSARSEDFGCCTPMEPFSVVIKAGLESLEIAKVAGVEIGFGTDVNMKAHPYQCEGLALQAWALSNADVTRSATLVNAKILKLEGRLGEIVAGAHADILVVDGNPYDDLTIFKDGGPNLRAIMKGGKLYKSNL